MVPRCYAYTKTTTNHVPSVPFTSSNSGSPVSLDRVPNSRMNVPTPAVHVMLVSPTGTPFRRFTVPYGIPVGVSNAASRRRATSSANRSSGPLQGQPGSTSTPALCRQQQAL